MWTVVFLCVSLLCVVNGQARNRNNRNRNPGPPDRNPGPPGRNPVDVTTSPIWGGPDDPRRHRLCDGFDGTGYPDEKLRGCRTYLECDNGILRVRSCAGGTVNFNRDQLRCEEEVDQFVCDDTGATTLEQLELGCPFGEPSDCTLFWECGAGGIPEQKRCNNGTMFSERFMQCIHQNYTIAGIQGCDTRSFIPENK